MAEENVTQYQVIEQLDETVSLLRDYTIFCHRVSALPVLSGTLAVQVAEGEPYECLARGIGQLHKNITEIAEYADRLCQTS